MPQEVEEPSNVTESIFTIMNETEVTPESQLIVKKGLEFKDGMNVLGILSVFRHLLNLFHKYCSGTTADKKRNCC